MKSLKGSRPRALTGVTDELIASECVSVRVSESQTGRWFAPQTVDVTASEHNSVRSPAVTDTLSSVSWCKAACCAVHAGVVHQIQRTQQTAESACYIVSLIFPCHQTNRPYNPPLRILPSPFSSAVAHFPLVALAVAALQRSICEQSLCRLQLAAMAATDRPPPTLEELESQEFLPVSVGLPPDFVLVSYRPPQGLRL